MMRASPSFTRVARECSLFSSLILRGINASDSQINVKGSGTQEPATADLVSIPGVYDNTKFPDIWADDFKSFTLPGPPLVQLGSQGTTNAGSPPPPPASVMSSSATHAPTTESAAPSSAAHPSAVHASAPTSAPRPSASSSLVSAPAPAATGRCKSRMVKRLNREHAAKRHAKRQHH
jgi:hypothetical protein